MKITLINIKVKFDKTQIIRISPEEIESLSESDLITKRHKKYVIYLNYLTYQIICPIVKNEEGEYTALIPAFKIPNSNIPIFVHFYAIALYLSSGESMRKVAAKVKKLFGLVTYSHSTISRTLKKMMCNLEENPDCFMVENWQITSQNKLANEKDITKNDARTEVVIMRRRWCAEYIEKANILLTFLLPVLSKTKNDILRNGTTISYEFYLKNEKYCA